MAEEQNVAEMQEAAEAQASIDAQSDSLSSEPSPKRKVKRGWIVAGVVAAVIVVAGVGFWVWHETPGFCNSVCHSPMDSYVETYYSGDKGMLVTAHADADENCLSCHEPVMTEQVGEAMKWVSDDYPMTPDGTKLATGKDFASEEFCAKSGCHNGYRVAESEISVREIAGQVSAARWLGETSEVAERDGRLRMGFEGSIGTQRQGARCEGSSLSSHQRQQVRCFGNGRLPPHRKPPSMSVAAQLPASTGSHRASLRCSRCWRADATAHIFKSSLLFLGTR